MKMRVFCCLASWFGRQHSLRLSRALNVFLNTDSRRAMLSLIMLRLNGMGRPSCQEPTSSRSIASMIWVSRDFFML